MTVIEGILIAAGVALALVAFHFSPLGAFVSVQTLIWIEVAVTAVLASVLVYTHRDALS